MAPPLGEISDIESPALTPTVSARREPTRTMSPPYSPSPKPFREPCFRLLAMIGVAASSAGRMPRTRPPVIWAGPVTMAWASITGTTWTTPGTARSRWIMASRPGPLMAGPVT